MLRFDVIGSLLVGFASTQLQSLPMLLVAEVLIYDALNN